MKVCCLNGMLFCDRVVVRAVQSAPVVHVAGRFDLAPLALVLRRDLIPVLDEIRPDVAVGRDVADEECGELDAAATTAAHGSEADGAVAVHPFAEAAAAATAVRIEPGVVALRLGLARGPVDDDVVHLHVAARGVIGERHRDAAVEVRRRAVVLETRRHCPGRDVRVVDAQADGLTTRRTARTHDDAVGRIGNLAIGDGAVAMHPFAVRAATATAIRVEPGVGALVLRLAGFPVDDDVIHLHVAAAAIVGERHRDRAREGRRRAECLEARRQRPGRDIAVAYAQRNRLAAGRAAGANHDRAGAALCVGFGYEPGQKQRGERNSGGKGPQQGSDRVGAPCFIAGFNGFHVQGLLNGIL